MFCKLFKILLITFCLTLPSVVIADSDEILAQTTSATQSTKFIVANGEMKLVYLFADSGLTAAEYGDLQISYDGGTTWADVYEDGSQTRLSSTNTGRTIVVPGTYRIDKEATTNATGVYLNDDGSF